MNISDTFFFMSSIKDQTLQWPPKTFVLSTEEILLLKEQPKNRLLQKMSKMSKNAKMGKTKAVKQRSTNGDTLILVGLSQNVWYPYSQFLNLSQRLQMLGNCCMAATHLT